LESDLTVKENFVCSKNIPCINPIDAIYYKIVNFILGSRQEIIPQDCAGFWFVYKAHPPVHIRICAGGCNTVDGLKDKQDV